MRPPRRGRALRWMAAGVGLAAAAYAGYVAMAWCRYGAATAGAGDEVDPLLDEFMPSYEVAERHHIRVAAPAAVTLAAAAALDFQQGAMVRAIFRAREVVLGTSPRGEPLPKGLLAQVKALGWGVLVEEPGREIVMGAVTKPWEADVVFRTVPPDQFRAFREPGYVKIAWTLRADPEENGGSIFRTETRVATTDAEARRRFRWYWARFSPGIILIRRFMLAPLKKAAERTSRGL